MLQVCILKLTAHKLQSLQMFKPSVVLACINSGSLWQLDFESCCEWHCRADTALRTGALKWLDHHLWHFGPELASLALINKLLPVGTKAHVVKTASKQPEPYHHDCLLILQNFRCLAISL